MTWHIYVLKCVDLDTIIKDMMKNIFVALFVLAVSSFSALQAEEEKNHKVVLFMDPTHLIAGGPMEVIQYLTWHPDVDTSVALRDIPEKDLEKFKQMVMAGEDDESPEEERLLERWFDEEDKLKKAGYSDKIKDFTQKYRKMELSHLTEEEQADARFQPVLDSGNRLAKKFRVSRYPTMVVIDVRTKRVTKYPLPSKFFDAVKSLDFLFKASEKQFKDVK